MARYTREEILHLRESPIIVFHTPPLPEWISADAIISAQIKNPGRPERQTPLKSARNADEPFTRVSRSDKSESTGTRVLPGSARDRMDRNEDRKNDRAEPSNRTLGTREPRKPEEGAENFTTRRVKKSDALTAGVRNARRGDQANESLNDKTESSRTSEPEWFAKSNLDDNDTQESSAGKTVDDFEKWKRSMKKNDGSGDTGLPELKNDNHESHESKSIVEKGEEPVKDVKPPPGFAGVRPVPPSDHSPDSSMLPGLFQTASPSTVRTGAPISEAQGASVWSASQTSTKVHGSSKFSKFFGQASQAPQSPKDSAQAEKTGQDGAVHNSSFFPSVPSANKDDAEGFERILAMLSTNDVSKRHGASARAGQGEHLQSYNEARGHPQGPPQLPSNQSSRYPPNLNLPPVQYNMDGLKSPPTFGGYDAVSPEHKQAPWAQRSYSPERNHRSMASSPPFSSTIMNHHTQNQDFFSSLLSQSTTQPEQNGMGSMRQPPLGGPPMHFDSRSSHPRPPYASEPQFAQLPHQHSRPPPGRSQARDEHEILNRLLPPQGPPQHHSGLHEHHNQSGRGPYADYSNGPGSRSAPAWNGHLDLDPRLSGASQQYRA